MADSKNKIRILYVDDEEPNLIAFKANYSRNYNVYVNTSATEALHLVKTLEPHIVISDQTMPEMSGIEFFEQLISINPDLVRILVTAYSDSQTIIDAINKGQIDKYLMKPWDHNIMHLAIKTSYTIYQSRIELRIKNEELRRTNAELNRFVYSVSHDLRAPLMSMLGLINLVRAENNPDEQARFFDLMNKSILKMDTYIQTTLEYYKNFKSELRIEPVHIETLVKDAIEAVSSYHAQAKINFQFQGIPQIYSDKTRMKICLNNIISNALKYGHKSSDPYEVTINCKHFDNELEVIVRDAGIGISETDLPKIYDMFYRSPQNKDKHGTGLGLYLVKEAIKRINGKIEVESALGQGTTFKLVIPNQLKDMKD